MLFVKKIKKKHFLQCDLPIRDVNQEEIEYAYRKGNYIGWTEVSAKEGLMVDDCMK